MAIDMNWIKAQVPQEKNRELFLASKLTARTIISNDDIMNQEQQVLAYCYYYHLAYFVANELHKQLEQKAVPAAPQNAGLTIQLQNEIDRLKREMASKERQQLVRSDLTTTLQELQEKQRALTEANQKILRLEAERDASQLQKLDKYAAAVGGSFDGGGMPSLAGDSYGGDPYENEELKKKNAELRKKVTSLENQLDNYQNGNTVSKSELIRAKNEIEKLRCYLDESSKALKKAKKENAALQARNDLLNEELERMKAAEEQNSKSFQENNKQILLAFEDMRAEMAALQQRSAAYQKDIREMQAQMKSKNQPQNDDLQSQYDACLAENENLRAQLAARSKETTKLTKQLLNMRRDQEEASEDETEEADAQ